MKRFQASRPMRILAGCLLAACMLVAIESKARAEIIDADSDDPRVQQLIRDVLRVPVTGNRSSAADRSLRKLRTAVERFRSGRFDEALASLEAAAKERPELAPARLMLARLFLGTGRVLQGRAELERVVRDAPADPRGYLAFGELALAEGRLTDALLHFDQSRRLIAAIPENDRLPAARVRDWDKQACSGTATVAERRQDWKAAEVALRQCLKLDADDAALRHRLGQVLFHLDRREEALATLTVAAESDESLEPPAVTMAWLHQRDGRTEQADRWMKRALDAHPDDSRVLRAAVLRLIELGRAEQAQTHIERLQRLEPDSPHVRYLAGLIAQHAGRHEQAEQIFEGLYRDSPADFATVDQLALALVEQRDERKRNRALQLAEVDARQYPRSAKALSTLGWVHFRLGNLEQAERFLRAAISGGRSNSETAYFLARVLAARGRTEQARRLVTAALDASGPFPQRTVADEWLKSLPESEAEQPAPDESPSASSSPGP